MQGDEDTKWEGYADWRNRAAVKGRHGGMLAASFVLGQSQHNYKFTLSLSFSITSLINIYLVSIDLVGIT